MIDKRKRVKKSIVNALMLLMAIVVGVPGFGNAAAAAGKEPVDLDVLFIGAHPDDEAGSLSTFGQWNEYEGFQTGVITVTRGEGGGNAAGPEEGAALGLIREKEERKAVGKAGITNIYNLDKLDFYYTVSAPLTEEMWDHDSSLEKVVRIVRTTRPEVIATMNPSPTPGNHGNHQYAARLAIEAYYAAADPNVFPEQIAKDGLQPWRAKKIFMRYADGTGENGSSCETSFVATEPTDAVYGVWNGRQSEKFGKNWGQVEREAMREYVTQGWAVFPDVSSDPQKQGCDLFTELDSRVPDVDGTGGSNGMLAGALKTSEGGFPLGTELYLTTDHYQLVQGQSFSVTANVLLGGEKPQGSANIHLELPKGWKSEGDGVIEKLDPGKVATTSFTVTVPKDADLKRVRLKAKLTAGVMSGLTSQVVNVAPDVTGTVQPLPQVAQFRTWTKDIGVPQLDNLIKPVLSIGAGETRSVEVDLRNNSVQKQSGNVTLQLPAGFKAEPLSRTYSNLAPGASGKVSFQVTNTNKDLPTANEGGDNGDYNFTVQTYATAGGFSSSIQKAALNLVPVATVAKANTAPRIDGTISDSEYPGTALNISRLWEGDKPTSEADASGTAKIVWYDDALYFAIQVHDDKLGSVLTPDDAKRHWRTDSVEIAIDPRGDSENTSTTFKVGIFPVTDDPANGNPAAAYRDADYDQGPTSQTAPGMVVKSKITQPYTGYTLEVKIPLADLPDSIDPQRMGMNIFIYDSDTQDKTGQTRLGWSTWGGVQGDPYRWGHAALGGYEALKEASVDVGRSAASPQSIMQSLKDHVPLAGGRGAGDVVHFVSGPHWQDRAVVAQVKADVAGKIHVFVWADEKTAAYETFELEAGKAKTITLPMAADQVSRIPADALVLAAFETADGATAAMSEAIAK